MGLAWSGGRRSILRRSVVVLGSADRESAEGPRDTTHRDGGWFCAWRPMPTPSLERAAACSLCWVLPTRQPARRARLARASAPGVSTPPSRSALPSVCR